MFLRQSGRGRKREDSDQPEGHQRTTLDNELYVSRLNLSTSRDSLKEHFSQFGEVLRVDLPIKYQSLLNKGYAFIAFKEASCVKNALAVSNKQVGQSPNIYSSPNCRDNSVTSPCSILRTSSSAHDRFHKMLL